MEKQLIKTVFIVKTKVELPEVYGGGWNAREVLEVKAKAGDVITCETFQTPSCAVEDTSVRLHFPNEIKTTSFETLGRLVACGAIEQVSN